MTKSLGSKQLNFHGASDDIFTVEGAICEEIYARHETATFHLKSIDGEMLVVAHYCKNGCWSVGIAPVDEEVPIPAWSTSFALDSGGYSAKLTIEAPADIHLATGEDDD